MYLFVTFLTIALGPGAPADLAVAGPASQDGTGGLCCVAEPSEQGPMSRYAPDEQVSSLPEDVTERATDEARAICADLPAFDLRDRVACELETGRALVSLFEAGVPWSTSDYELPMEEDSDSPLCGRAEGACGPAPVVPSANPRNLDALRVVTPASAGLASPGFRRVIFPGTIARACEGYSRPPERPPTA